MSSAFKPVVDPAALEQILQELLASCDEELAEDAASAATKGAAEQATEASRKGAAQWKAFGQTPMTAPTTMPPAKGGRSLLDIRLGTKKP